MISLYRDQHDASHLAGEVLPEKVVSLDTLRALPDIPRRKGREWEIPKKELAVSWPPWQE